MKRRILAITTALSLALPAFAQSDAAQMAARVLERHGYDVAVVDSLTAAQITEIYLSATSGDEVVLRQTLRGMNLPARHTEMEVTPDIQGAVVDTLAMNGYDPAAVTLLSTPEIVAVYISSTSEDEAELQRTLAGLSLPQGDLDMTADWVVSMPSSGNVERVVTVNLVERGYSASQIATLTQAERAEIYLALTSEDANQVQSAIDGAFES